jgi:hypothetical protein
VVDIREEDSGSVVDRLIKEVRQLHSVLDDIHRELFNYVDLDKLSLSGAIAYLIRHKRILDEIKILIKRANRKPEKALDQLYEIEKLIDEIDD